jgi:beta-glucanase (GH16 family)
MQLVWSDEFDGNSINSANWSYDIGANGWGNQELQNYTSSPDNSYLQDGKLIIKAVQSGPNNYSSSRLKSINLQEYQYGRIDVRAVLPVGQGIWPAIWMLGANFDEIGWPDCGEIDIMELVGHQPNRVYGTAHWGADPSQHQYQSGTIALPSGQTFDEEFHVFSIEWQEDEIRWLMDDEVYHTVNPSTVGSQPYPFNQPFFFILNVAVGGVWPGYPDETTLFPVYMAVDYVRVYQTQ